MRGNFLIGPLQPIRAAVILVVLVVASRGSGLLAVERSVPVDSRAAASAIDSGARDGWEARSDSLPNRQSGPRQFDRDPLDDRIRHAWHQLAALEQEPDFNPVPKPF